MTHPLSAVSEADLKYSQLIRDIIANGTVHDNRTGVPTRRIWGHMARLNLAEGFPLLTTKKMAVKSAFVEMLGFVRGETDVRWYQERGCNIWNADHARWHGKELEKDRARYAELATASHELQHMAAPAIADEASRLLDSIEFRESDQFALGKIYGAQFRDFNGYDQLAEIIKALRAGSNSRRLIMSAWAPDQFHLMCLPPCHVAYHFVKRDEFVDVAMWQRSCDTALGVPYNWANTALIAHLVAHAAGLKPGRMVWYGDDVHIYEPHVEGLRAQLEAKDYPAPQLKINKPVGTDPWDIEFEDLELVGYQSSPAIKFELFVG